MKLATSRESLLRPLQAVIGVVERRQTMPILSNVLMVAKDQALTVTATDLEVELVASSTPDDLSADGEITVPARKLLDICRALPDEAVVKLQLDGDRLTVRSGRSRFVLSTLPAADFPVIEDIQADRAAISDPSLFWFSAIQFNNINMKHVLFLNNSILRISHCSMPHLLIFHLIINKAVFNSNIILGKRSILIQ